MADTPDPKTGLTPKEKALVKNNWDLVRKDPLKNGIALFMVFFKMYPQYKNYFKFRDVPDDELPNDKRLQKHATTVLYSLSSLIDTLDDPQILLNLLEGLGERHGKRKVPPVAFDDLTEAVLALLRQGLGNEFTEDAEKAWRKTLNVSMSVMKSNLNVE